MKRFLKFLIKNEKNIDNFFMLFVSFLQTSLILILGVFVLKNSFFNVIITIISIQILIVYLYNINHYSVIKCTFFTLFVFFIGLIPVPLEFFILKLIAIILILEKINKATIKKNSDYNFYFFAKGETLGKNLINVLIYKKGIVYFEEELKKVKEVDKFDYYLLATLYFDDHKSIDYIANEMGYTYSYVNQKKQDLYKILINCI